MGEFKDSITKEFMSSIERVDMFFSGRMDSSSFIGARKSHAKGSSLDFSDFREYIQGDDIRRLDWNSYARFDKLFMKIFEEERQADINIFIDVSKSMSVETLKSVYSRQIAFAIAYIALKNTDRVNIFVFGNGIKARKLKLQSISKMNEIIDFMDNIEYDGETDISKSIKDGSLDINGRGISYIISDFLSDENFMDTIKLLLYKKQEVSVIHTLSEKDENPEIYGNIRLIDVENSSKNIDVCVDKAIIESYKKELSNFKSKISRFCKKNSIKYTYTLCGEKVYNTIIRAL